MIEIGNVKWSFGKSTFPQEKIIKVEKIECEFNKFPIGTYAKNSNELQELVKEKEAMAPYVKRKSVNFTVSEELHLKFDVACTLNNTKMAWVLRKLIEGYVANTKNFK